MGIALFIIGWIVCGFIGMLIAMIAEKYMNFSSSGKGALLVAGYLGLALALLFYGLMFLYVYAEKIADKFEDYINGKHG